MSEEHDSPEQLVWREYSIVFQKFDDLTLARWLVQTLGQLEGHVLRSSHPLVGAYRIGAQLAYDRQIWHKRLASPPGSYTQAECCRAPLVPVFTRDIRENGLMCQSCYSTAIEFGDIPEDLRGPAEIWAKDYASIHAVAHWGDNRRKARDYEEQLEIAALRAEAALFALKDFLLPKFLDHYPVIVWEDQDACLEVLPEDILPKTPPLS